MYNRKKRKPKNGTLKLDQSYEGITIERRIEKLTVNKEPISDNSPMMYTDRKDGVLPQTNVRTDRFEIAQDVMTHASKSKRAKRDEVAKPKGDGGAEPIGGTK